MQLYLVNIPGYPSVSYLHDQQAHVSASLQRFLFQGYLVHYSTHLEEDNNKQVSPDLG